ncbi:MAG: hypothetical protein WC965_02245 [Thiohalomonadaceae bacterium]
MSGEPEALALTADEFEATARRITHQWMRHLGYKQHAIDGAEQLAEDDTPIDIDDPAADAIRDLLDSGELVMFVMERLAGLSEVGVPVAARDEAAELRAENAELRAAAEEALEAIKHQQRDPAYHFAFLLLQRAARRLRAALSASEGQS